MAKNAPETGWATPPATLLRPGPDFDLGLLDRAGTPGWEGDKHDAARLMADRGELLSDLQERLFAEGRTGGSRSVLLVVQGLDTAGKGGIVRHVVGMVDPQGVALRAFGVPTAEERRHHYLWRVRRALPRPGLIGVFDRSHYEDVLVARVERLVEEPVWSRRYDEINRFERQVAARGTTIVKVALMVSRQEQGIRLMERLDRPDKHWKFNPGDVDTRLRWDDYQQAYTDVFARTSTDVAPWHVIPADRKWYARLAVTELLTQAIIDLDLDWPRARWRVGTQKRRLAATMAPEVLAEAAENADELAAEVRESEEDFTERVREADDGVPPVPPAGQGSPAEDEGTEATGLPRTAKRPGKKDRDKGTEKTAGTGKGGKKKSEDQAALAKAATDADGKPRPPGQKTASPAKAATDADGKPRPPGQKADTPAKKRKGKKGKKKG